MTQYDVYLRNANGKRTTLVNGIVFINALMRFNEPTKWSISGTGLEECPIEDSSDIAIFRNGIVLFCGYTESKKTKYNANSKIYDWEVSGKSDLGKIGYRLLYTQPNAQPPNPNKTYSDSGYLSTVMLDLLRKNAGELARENRQFTNLVIPVQTPYGDEITIECKLENLLNYVQNQLKASEIQIKESWNMSTGKWTIRIEEPEDVSDKVIFSVDNGSISAWERTVSAPKSNYIMVTGCKDENDQLIYVRVEDLDSVAKWGRIETVVARSDIKRNEEASESWESVTARLHNAANEELEKATAKTGYKLTTSEVSRNAFLEDYDIGSIVSVRIGSDNFTSKVEEVKITYAKGIETIIPSVGTMQKGELQSVFAELGKLKEQVKVLQNG